MTATLGLVAGETSGDMLAAQMLAGLQQQIKLDVRGVAGKQLVSQGMQAWHGIDELSVRGYVEVIKHLPRLLAMRKSLMQRLVAWHPQLFIGVDAPDFNLALEAKLRAHKIKTVHFIGPSIWAWRYERIEKIRQAVDHLLLVFPFEKAIYDKEGITSTYVGHPLADKIPMEVPLHQHMVALLPGSRMDEVKAMGLEFLRAAKLMLESDHELRFVLPAASLQIESFIAELFAAHPSLREALGDRIQITSGQSHAAIAQASAVLVASGTASLEVALFKKPMVIAYKMPCLSYRLMKNKGYLPYIGLPNILAKEFAVPELVQDAATAQALAKAMLKQISDEQNRRYLVERFTTIHESLRCNCASRSANVLFELLSEKN